MLYFLSRSLWPTRVSVNNNQEHMYTKWSCGINTDLLASLAWTAKSRGRVEQQLGHFWQLGRLCTTCLVSPTAGWNSATKGILLHVALPKLAFGVWPVLLHVFPTWWVLVPQQALVGKSCTDLARLKQLFGHLFVCIWKRSSTHQVLTSFILQLCYRHW